MKYKYRGMFIARIPNDEQAEQRIAAYKAEYGQLRMYGRHKDRKGTMQSAGRRLNTHGDLPWRLGAEIVIYCAESGMTYPQFQNLAVGDLVARWSNPNRQPTICIVLDKKGKNLLQVQLEGRTTWLKRQALQVLET